MDLPIMSRAELRRSAAECFEKRLPCPFPDDHPYREAWEQERIAVIAEQFGQAATQRRHRIGGGK